ncbi:MAG: adenine phosphoribosyltransferase [Acidimicrobiia bacterium]
MPVERFRDLIRDVPDFPEPGIMFKDITPLLADPTAFQDALSAMTAPFSDDDITAVVGIEARGFIFGAPLASRLGAAFVPVRKPGKLPWRVQRLEYALEYGTDALEVHEDAIRLSDRVLVVDDVLATGGTARATIDLVKGQGAEIAGLAVFIELAFLGARAKLADVMVHSVLHYDGS